MTSKQFAIRVSSPSGEYLGQLPFTSLPPFVKSLDGGLGDLSVPVEAAFDSNSALLAEGNRVEVVVKDADVADSPERRVYGGYVSRVRRSLSQRETVTLDCLGWHTLLSTEIFREGATTKLTRNMDVGAMAIDVIAKYNVVNPASPFHADADYLIDVDGGPSVSYVFDGRTCREALDDVLGLSSGGQHWYVDADARLRFRAPSAEPDHELTFNRHFHALEAEKSLDKVRNRLLLWNGVTGEGSVYSLYEDADSVAACGQPRLERVTDYGATTATAADAIAARFLADRAWPPVTVTMRVADDGGYDIESFEPGDTVLLLGLGDATWAKYAMTVTSVTYGYDYVDLTMDTVPSGLGRFQRSTAREISRLLGAGAPDEIDNV